MFKIVFFFFLYPSCLSTWVNLLRVYMCACDPAGVSTRHWRCCRTPRRWRRRWATVRTGRTRFLLSCSPHSVRGRWTDRPSYTVGGNNRCLSLIIGQRYLAVAHWCSLPAFAPPSSELFTTEASHLRTLRVLDQVFFQKMRSVLNHDELTCIFPKLPEVYELHGQSVCFFSVCVCVCQGC